MRLERINLEVEYLTDMITHNGFLIRKENHYAVTNIDNLINSSEFTDTEYRCDCGAFKGQDIVGQVCPCCHSEISLHSLNFQYTGWIDLGKHKIISPVYYNMIKRVIGNNMLRFILGDYKTDISVKYNENDKDFEENKNKKKKGRISTDDIKYIINKIPKSKQHYQGIGHDEFCKRFEEIIINCAPKNHKEVDTLLKEKHAVFTSKIPIYSTAYRPVSKTSESMFYPKINKSFSMICADACRLDDMILDVEVIRALNAIQNHLIKACDSLIQDEIAKKNGYVRSEIVGGTFTFSARSVITLDNSLRDDWVDIPFSTAITVYQYRITHMLATRYNMTLEQAYLFVNNHERDPIVVGLLDEIIEEGQWVVYLREPTNNVKSIVLAKIRHYKFDTDTLSLPTEVLPGLNADFDGDAIQMVFIPKELVPSYEAFHHSCMINYIKDEIPIELMNWNSVCLGNISL